MEIFWAFLGTAAMIFATLSGMALLTKAENNKNEED